MSNQDNSDEFDNTLRPRVVVIEKSGQADAGATASLAPRILETTQTGRIVPAPPPERLAASRPSHRRRTSLTKKLAWTGLLVAFGVWLGVDLNLWIASAFNYGTGLGWAAVAAAGTGLAAAGTIIARELRSYLALREVEANQRRLTAAMARPTDMQKAIREVIAEVPKDHESKAAIEAFQRKVQRHHSP